MTSKTRREKVEIALRWIIAMVWFCNGLGAKVLGLIPRHELIVARILGETHAEALTVAFGFGEVAIGLWFLSAKWHRINAIVQIALVASMNLLEFFLASDLLLWGHRNILFATIFLGLVWFYEFRLRKT